MAAAASDTRGASSGVTIGLPEMLSAARALPGGSGGVPAGELPVSGVETLGLGIRHNVVDVGAKKKKKGEEVKGREKGITSKTVWEHEQAWAEFSCEQRDPGRWRLIDEEINHSLS